MLQPDMPLRAPLNDIADGYFETDLKGRLRTVNPSLCRMMACADPAQLTGAPRDHFIDAETWARLRPIAKRVLDTGEYAQEVEVPVTRRDGERRTFEVSISLLRDAADTPCGFCGIVRDVTERVQAAAEQEQRVSQLGLLQQMDVELNQMLSLESVLAVALNAALLVSSAEAGFVGLIEHEQLRLARSVGDYPQEMLTPKSGSIARAIRSQCPECLTDVQSEPDSASHLPQTCSQIVVPLVAHEKLVGILNLETASAEHFTPEVFEFTQVLGVRIAAAIENAVLYEQLQAQLAELRSLYAQVSDLEQLKTYMIRIAAHDLRSPLAIIASYIELINDDLAAHYTPMDAMYVNAIRQSVTRMTQMTSDILSLERLHEHHDVTLMRVQLGSLLEHTVGEFAQQSELQNQQLHMSIEPLSIYGDATELHEALANLIGNAVKYTPGGGTIEARLVRDGDDALVEVIDTGYGIPEDQQAQLFQPFHRVRTRETRAIDGTGLGLYLVKTIVERHHGTVHFQSAPGKGSLFGFRLPLAKTGINGEE
jgi:PAS domain S-box-containing protein